MRVSRESRVYWEMVLEGERPWDSKSERMLEY